MNEHYVHHNEIYLVSTTMTVDDTPSTRNYKCYCGEVFHVPDNQDLVFCPNDGKPLTPENTADL